MNLIESDAYTHHKPIRNKIRTYDPIPIIKRAVWTFHSKIDPSSLVEVLDNGGYLPWEILLLIRWVYQYTEPNVSPKIITANQFHNLIRAIRGLGGQVISEGQKGEDLYFTFRRSMVYQLPFQIRDYELFSSLGRQLVMFNDLGSQYNLDSTFQDITDLCLKDFFELYLACWFACKQDSLLKLSVEYFQKQFPKTMIRKFFGNLALTIPKAQEYIKGHSSKDKDRKKIGYQINEHTPLERYPFFEHEGLFFPYSWKLLSSSLMYNVYDIFKEHNPDFSRDSFGNIFENYIAKGIEYKCLNFLPEKEIKSLLPRDSKCADFLIQEDQASILIDAKSTELNPIVRVLQYKESLVRNMESTIICAVLQIITTAYHLRCKKRIDEANQLYGIVITYKDYLIGTGKDFWEKIIGDHVKQKLKEKGIKNFVPPENLFFISIEEFDFLIAGAKEKNLSISKILLSVTQRNRLPETKCLMLKQHLLAIWGEYYRPEYINDRLSGCFDKLKLTTPHS